MKNVNISRRKNKKMITSNYKGNGIYTSLFSFDIKWLDDLLVPITTWKDYTDISQEASSKVNRVDDYILEHWFYNYLLSKNVINDIDIIPETKHRNIVDQGDYEPGMKVCVSETEHGNIVLFIINIGSEEDEPFTIYYNDRYIREGTLQPKGVYDAIFDKQGTIKVKDSKTTTTFNLEPDKTYTDTRFKYYDDKVKCINWNDNDSIGFIDNITTENITYTFVDGAKVDITGNNSSTYHIDFIDNDTDIIVHSDDIKINHWTRPNRMYYTNWKINVYKDGELIDNHVISLEDKNVLIYIDTNGLGDTLAWIPYTEEFRKKHKCNLYVTTHWNNLFEKEYTDITFLKPGQTPEGMYAYYSIGCRDDDYEHNKTHWRLIPLQQVASDYLGLDNKGTTYEEIKPLITRPDKERPIKEPYITISQFSTFKCKEWNNPMGWQEVIDVLNERGIKTMVVSKESTNLKHIIDRTNSTINQTINNIQHSELFIGPSTGPTWLAWALNIPTIMISGYSKEWHEMKSCHRIINKDVCNGCINNLSYKFDRGNWNWCPVYDMKQVEQFICTKSISPSIVLNTIDNILQNRG